MSRRVMSDRPSLLLDLRMRFNDINEKKTGPCPKGDGSPCSNGVRFTRS